MILGIYTDQYFSRLKTYIETAHRISGKKVCLVSHSMGSQVVMFFFKWVEAEGYGGGGNQWVETHIEAFINVCITLPTSHLSNPIFPFFPCAYTIFRSAAPCSAPQKAFPPSSLVK